MTEAAKPAERKIIGPFPNVMLEQSFAFSVFMLTVPNGTPPEDVKRPEFWANLRGALKVNDRVHVMPEDGEWTMEVIIRAERDGVFRTGQLSFVNFGDPAVPTEVVGEYEIKWRGPHARYGVIRRSDGHMLRANFAHKGEAMQYILDQQKFAA